MIPVESAEFAERLQRVAPEPLSAAAVAALYGHYRLLLRWNERVSLVGPGTLADAIEVHYGEALAALGLIPPFARGCLLDVGTGAGFPGFVLAAVRPELRVFLVEAHERKWAFLKAAVLAGGVAAECVHGAIDRSLPAGLPERLDWVTIRALKLPARGWETLTRRLAEDGRVLVWAGREDPVIPLALLRRKRAIPLPGSRWKRILELERA